MGGSNSSQPVPANMGSTTKTGDNSENISLISFHYTTWAHTTPSWFGLLVLVVLIAALTYCCCTPRVRTFFGWNRGEQQHRTYGYGQHPQPYNIPMMPHPTQIQPHPAQIQPQQISPPSVQSFQGASVELRNGGQ